MAEIPASKKFHLYSGGAFFFHGLLMRAMFSYYALYANQMLTVRSATYALNTIGD